MYCPKCGGEVNDDADVCIHCGCSLTKSKPEYKQTKTGIGVVMALFLGIIGLIIGICMYPADTIARKTFIKGWCTTYAVAIGIVAFILFIVNLSIPSNPYYY